MLTWYTYRLDFFFNVNYLLLYQMKTIQDRLEECIAMRLWLKNLQIDDEPECGSLRKTMIEFVQNGQPASGSFQVNKLNRKVYFKLTTRPVDSQISLNPLKK